MHHVLLFSKKLEFYKLQQLKDKIKQDLMMRQKWLPKSDSPEAIDYFNRIQFICFDWQVHSQKINCVSGNWARRFFYMLLG